MSHRLIVGKGLPGFDVLLDGKTYEGSTSTLAEARLVASYKSMSRSQEFQVHQHSPTSEWSRMTTWLETYWQGEKI